MSLYRLHLAPMEGLVDPLVRDVWTRGAGFELCTTEFIRVTNQLLPQHVFERECPELLNSSRTSSGVPVAVQLLGGDANVVAENAARAAEMGAYSIDLNFGCPAPTVNRHDGGAVLLQYPDRIFKIVEAVRKAVRVETPVSAKLRLGFMDTELCIENCRAAASGGIVRLTVHCRTKKDFYHPPAHWHWIPEIRKALNSAGLGREAGGPELFANGEIWTVEDFQRCHAETQADGYVIGRGAIADPFLASDIQANSVLFDQSSSLAWSRRLEFLREYLEVCIERESPRYALTRFKQTLRFMEKRWPEAAQLFEGVKRLDNLEDLSLVVGAPVSVGHVKLRYTLDSRPGL